MDNDDQPIGRILTRREVLALLGSVGAGLLAGCAPGQAASTQAGVSTTSAPTLAPAPTLAVASTASTAGVVTAAPTGAPTASLAAVAAAPSCIARPALTEGPYFVDEQLNRVDIRSDPSDGSVREGLPLQLAFNVSQLNGSACTPLAGATVDVWHCDAAGVYSDVTDPNFKTTGKKFLRGYQVTDANGLAQFTTIYPGWYRGRTVHIHFKIRLPTTSGSTYDFTSQLFFDDATSNTVYTQAPYAAKGQRNMRNTDDGIFNSGGEQLILQLTPATQGYTTAFNIGLQID